MFFKKKYFIVSRNRTIHYIFLPSLPNLHRIYMPHCRWCRFSTMGSKFGIFFLVFCFSLSPRFAKNVFTLEVWLPLR